MGAVFTPLILPPFADLFALLLAGWCIPLPASQTAATIAVVLGDSRKQHSQNRCEEVAFLTTCGYTVKLLTRGPCCCPKFPQVQKRTMQIHREGSWRGSKHRMLILAWEVPEMHLAKTNS